MIQYDDTTNESPEYADFIEKFKPKKTTDDCYTPDNIYNAVLAWAVKEYKLEGRKVLRPFYPGGDYEGDTYPEGCVVIDNPPFSILSKICAFYDKKGIDYFLFAPALTLFSTNSGRSNYVIADADIVYENGAKVKTGFVTNMGTDRVILSPELMRSLRAANDENTRPTTTLPKYAYPDNVITAAHLQKLVNREVSLRIPRSDASFIRALDEQRKQKKAIYGAGFLLSEKAAKEAAEAAKEAAEEKMNVHKWKLSMRELDIIRSLSAVLQTHSY